MLWHWLFNIITPMLANVNAQAPVLPLQMHDYLTLCMAYLMETNNFFPVTDAYIPISLFYLVYYTWATIVYLTAMLVNLIRGSGIRM